VHNQLVLEKTVGMKRIAIASYIHNKAIYVTNYDEATMLYGNWYVHKVMRRIMLYNAVVLGLTAWKAERM